MDAYDRLVLDIHESAIEPAGFPDLASRISDFVGAGSIHMLLFDPDTATDHVSLFERGDPDFSDEYVRDYMAHDFRVPRVLAQRPAALVEEAAYVGREEARGSEIHQSLLPRYGIHNIAGSNLGVDGAIGWFGMSTRKADRPFEARQLDLAGRLMPHLGLAYRSVLANARARRSRAALAAALDRLGGAVLVFEDGEPGYANEAADALLDAGFFRLMDWRLGCRSPIESRRMAELFTRPAGSQGSLVARDLETGTAYHVHVATPVGKGRPARSARTLERVVTVTPLNPAGPPDPDTLAAFAGAWGLTPGEAAVVGATLAFVPLRSHAARRRVSLDTVQKQLKSALARMGLANQKALFQAFERFRLTGG